METNYPLLSYAEMRALFDQGVANFNNCSKRSQDLAVRDFTAIINSFHQHHGIHAIFSTRFIAEVFVKRCVIYLKDLRHTESLSDIAAAALIDPTYSEVYYFRAMNMIHMNDFPAAIHNLSKLIDTSTTPDVECLIVRSHAYLQGGDLYSARIDFDKAVRIDNSLATSFPQYAGIAKTLSEQKVVVRTFSEPRTIRSTIFADFRAEECEKQLSSCARSIPDIIADLLKDILDPSTEKYNSCFQMNNFSISRMAEELYIQSHKFSDIIMQLNGEETTFLRKFTFLRVLTMAMRSGNRQLIRELLTHSSLLKTLGKLMRRCNSTMLQEIGPITFTPGYSQLCSNIIPTKYRACILAEQAIDLVYALSSCCDTPEVKSSFIETGIVFSLKQIYAAFKGIWTDSNSGKGLTLDLSDMPILIEFLEGSGSLPLSHGLSRAGLRCSNPTCPTAVVTSYEYATKPLMRCTGCCIACYCTRDCQKIHWKKHKKDCEIISKST